MASNILKCANCNLVVNELLAFIQNKADVMNEGSLVKICCDSFTNEEIVTSKKLLFDSVPNSKRVMRRNKEKNVRDIDDIICLLKLTDPETVPTFVARDLQKLPPVTFDHVDVSKLLKDIVLLQSNQKAMQNDCASVSQLLELKCEIEALKQASIVNNHYDFVNKRRGGAFPDLDVSTLDSGPRALSLCLTEAKLPFPSPKCTENSVRDISPVYEGTQQTRTFNYECSERVVLSPTRVRHSPPAQTAHASPKPASAVSFSPSLGNVSPKRQVEVCPVVDTPTICASSVNSNVMSSSASNDRVVTKRTMADVVRVNDRREQGVGDAWTKVEHKTRKNKRSKEKIGKANVGPDGKFKSADIKLPIFISNVAKDTTENDIITYIKQKTNDDVTIFKINRQNEKRYNSFKLYIPKNKVDMFLQDDFWPNGITFRRFVHDKYIAKAVLMQN